MISLHYLISNKLRYVIKAKTHALWVPIHTAHNNSMTQMFFGETGKTSYLLINSTCTESY